MWLNLLKLNKVTQFSLTYVFTCLSAHLGKKSTYPELKVLKHHKNEQPLKVPQTFSSVPTNFPLNCSPRQRTIFHARIWHINFKLNVKLLKIQRENLLHYSDRTL